MTQFILCMCTLLILYHPNENDLRAAYTQIIAGNYEAYIKSSISVMEGLDLVKARYAANFEKVYDQNTKDYYYKLPGAEYYLYYEGVGETDQDYLYHFYEYVLDDPDTGMGHAVTYGWYSVNKSDKSITDHTH